jgi:hypothetical protein
MKFDPREKPETSIHRHGDHGDFGEADGDSSDETPSLVAAPTVSGQR